MLPASPPAKSALILNICEHVITLMAEVILQVGLRTLRWEGYPRLSGGAYGTRAFL